MAKEKITILKVVFGILKGLLFAVVVMSIQFFDKIVQPLNVVFMFTVLIIGVVALVIGVSRIGRQSEKDDEIRPEGK